MQPKMKRFFVLLFACIFAFSLGAGVLADDDHGKNEHEDSHEHSDDGNDYYSPTVPTQEVFWNIWLRQPINNPNNPLPINTPSELSISINGKESKLYFIPQEGQLLVSGDQIASFLGGHSEYYPQSKILVITKDKNELIVRADSNAAYENKVKNPMPVQAEAYEKTIYLPVSVAANALGFRITWDAGNNTMVFESI